MKCFLYALSLALILLSAPAFAETVKVGVDGMVCDFCAQSIKKVFLKDENVSDVQINLDEKRVTIVTKEGASISDEAINEAIDYSGYKVSGIERGK